MRQIGIAFLTIFTSILFFITGCCTEDWEGPRGDPSLITPYVNKTEMVETVGPFSAIHHGLDLFPLADLASFQAAASGRVERVELFHNPSPDVYQVNVMITYNSAYMASYAFEPCSDYDVGNSQLALITVSVGQMVNAGDEIGKLLKVVDGSHLDFGLLRDWVGICPYPYFTTEARDSILSLAVVDGRMCDCHP